MAVPASNNARSRWLLVAAGGCGLLVACVVVTAAVAGVLALRGRGTQAGAPNVEYVLDASPRMLQETDGSTRLSVAQGVLAEIVRPASPAVAAGLRVFGTGQLTGACQDTNLLVPLAAANQENISAELTALTGGAGVDSALGVAMVAAIRDLAATKGPHSLVVVTGGADSCNAQADQLIAAEAKRQGVQLQVFVVGFEVSDSDSAALQGVVDQTTDAKYIQADSPDDLRRSLQAIQAYVDQPGTVTVASVVATSAATLGAPVANTPAGTAPPPDTTPQNTGLFQLTVLGYDGQPAAIRNRLQVQAFSPQDHKTVLADSFDNPAALRLPAGQYDVLIIYGAAAATSFVGGNVSQWITGVSIAANQTTTQTYDLKLGQVTLTVLEAAGKPAPDGNYLFSFRVYNVQDFSNYVASVIVTTTATFQLAPGTYQMKIDYPMTAIINQDQSANTFDVKSGQSLDYSFDLKLGHLSIEVDDNLGQPLDASRVNASAYEAGVNDPSFSDSYSLNPTDLLLQADKPYTVIIKLDTGQTLTLSSQQVREGEVQTIKVAERDFK